MAKNIRKATEKDSYDENTISEEDDNLNELLETCVSTPINKGDKAIIAAPIWLKVLDVIVTKLQSAMISMTSVPKPLKCLRPIFFVLKE